MIDEHSESSPDVSALDAVIAEYIQSVETGKELEREALLVRHPELAEGLREFFSDFDRAEREVAPLRAEGGPLPIPETLRNFGEYELLEEIGRGGMGIVYRARHKPGDRLVALKMILTGPHASAEQIERFRREAQAAARLEHPRIVPVHEVGEHQGRPYYTMKLFDGGDLTRHMERYPDVPDLAAATVIQVAQAVHHAHEHGILHRDLKPANILLDSEGRPHVADFGLARNLADPILTHSSAVLGTLGYMAPEQAQGFGQLTPAADVYSLGAILYALLTGRPLFHVATLAGRTERILPGPRRLNPKVGRDLEMVCLKCLEADPARRYGSAAELADDLYRCLRGEQAAARGGVRVRTVQWLRRNPAIAALLLLVALVAGLGIVAVIWKNEEVAHAQRQIASEQEKTAEEQERVAQAEEEIQRQRQANEAVRRRQRLADHANLIARAAQALQAGDAEAAMDRLDDCPWDTPGWEWHYLCRLAQGPPGERITPAKARRERDTPMREVRIPALVGAVRTALSADGRRLAVARYDERVGLASWGVGAILTPAPLGLLAAPPRDRGSFIEVYDTATGRLLSRFHGHRQPATCLALSPDGKQVASVSAAQVPAGKDDSLQPLAAFTQTVAVWEADTGRLIAAKTEQGTATRDRVAPWILTVQFQSAGPNVLLLGANGRSNWFDVASSAFRPSPWNEARRFGIPIGSPNPTEELAIRRAPDLDWFTGFNLPWYAAWERMPALLAEEREGKFLVCAKGVTICPWFLDHQEAPGLEQVRNRSAVIRSLALRSPDRLIASGQQDGTIALCTVESTTTLRILRGHTGAVRCLAFSPDGRRLASGGEDGSLRLWDAESGLEMLLLDRRSAPVVQVAFDSAGETLTAVCDGGSVQRWDARHEVVPNVLRVRGRPIFCANGELLATGPIKEGAGANDAMTVWNLRTGQLKVRIPVETTAFPRTVAISPDGRQLLKASFGKNWEAWDVNSGKLLWKAAEDHGVYRLVFSPDGKTFVAQALHTMREHPPGRTGEVLREYQQEVAQYYMPTLSLHDAETGRKLRELSGEADASTGLGLRNCPLSFSPDGRYLVVHGRGETGVLLADSESDLPPRRALDLRQDSLGLSFGELRVYEVATGRIVFRFCGTPGKSHHQKKPYDDRQRFRWEILDRLGVGSDHGGNVTCAAFRPDGRRIAALAQNWGVEWVKEWDLETGQETFFRQLRDPDRHMAFEIFYEGGEILAWMRTEGSNELVLMNLSREQRLLSLPDFPAEYLQREDRQPLAFGPGHRLIAGSRNRGPRGPLHDDPVVEVWDLIPSARRRPAPPGGS